MKNDFSKSAFLGYTSAVVRGWTFPLWLRALSISIAGFKLPFGIVFLSFLGMLSWSLFYDLGSVDMNVWDESLFAIRAYQLYENGSFLQNFNQFPGLYDHASTKLPFVTLLQAASFYVFGPNVWALRFPIGLLAIGCILLMTRILFRLGINSKWGLLMGLFMVCSNSFMGEHMLLTGDHDAPLAFFLLLAGLYFFEYLHIGRKKSIWGFSFWFLAALLTKNILAVVVVPAWLCFSLFSGKGKWVFQDRRLYASAMGIFSIYVSVIALFEISYPGFFNRMWNYELMGRYSNVIEGHTGPWYYYINLLFKEDAVFTSITVIAVSVFLWTYIFQSMKRKWRFETLEIGENLFVFTALMVLFYLGIVSHSQTKLPWYHAPLFPMMAVLTVLGLRHIGEITGLKTQGGAKVKVNTKVFMVADSKFEEVGRGKDPTAIERGGFSGKLEVEGMHERGAVGLRIFKFLGLGILGLSLVTLWFTTSKKAHNRSTIFGNKGYLALFSELKEKELLVPHTYIIEDDFGSDTYFYVKSFAENAKTTDFHFTRDIDLLKAGDAVMIKKPWLLLRLESKFETENILKLEDVHYRRIKALRTHPILE